jgi:hypothetical protein
VIIDAACIHWSWAEPAGEIAMANNNQLSKQTDAQLIAQYVENIRTHDAIEHAGAAKRHIRQHRFDRCEFGMQYT